MSTHRVDVAVFAVALTVFGLVALALVWSGDWAYAAFANATGHTSTTFTSYGPGPGDPCCPSGYVESPISLDALLAWHRGWAAYVTGASAEAPVSFGRSTFTQDEYAHMADVRNVFRGAEIAAALGLGVVAFRLIRARGERRALRLIRDGGLVSAGLVALIGVAAAFAFDPLFLLFHEVFFPQGNFLFDPATSNLVRLYPEWYWEGVTAGVGVSFVGLVLVAAIATHTALRRSATYTRAA